MGYRPGHVHQTVTITSTSEPSRPRPPEPSRPRPSNRHDHAHVSRHGHVHLSPHGHGYQSRHGHVHLGPRPRPLRPYATSVGEVVRSRSRLSRARPSGRHGRPLEVAFAAVACRIPPVRMHIRSVPCLHTPPWRRSCRFFPASFISLAALPSQTMGWERCRLAMPLALPADERGCPTRCDRQAL
jgi:hypothetical protein